MIQKLRIKNFRSFKEITVDLKQVNLLIGPNNSGKSNFLKAFEFLHLFYTSGQLTQDSFSRNYFGFWEPKSLKNNYNPISFSFSFKIDDERFGIYIIEIFGATDTSWPIYRELFGVAKKDLSLFEIDNVHLHAEIFYTLSINVINNAPIDKVCSDFQIGVPRDREFVLRLNEDLELINWNTEFTGFDFVNSFKDIHSDILMNVFEKIVICQPDTNKLKIPGSLGVGKHLNSDASNLVSFLDNMRDSNPEILEEIRRGIIECIED
ncbi:MAG: AAA family ATPase, partial [Bacteroidales bacterium]|nr:AAA family ATPase [Bacteroidales bacterium]